MAFKKTMLICCDLSDQEWDDLKKIAKRQSKSVKTLFHDLLTEYIDQKLHSELSFL